MITFVVVEWPEWNGSREIAERVPNQLLGCLQAELGIYSGEGSVLLQFKTLSLSLYLDHMMNILITLQVIPENSWIFFKHLYMRLHFIGFVKI